MQEGTVVRLFKFFKNKLKTYFSQLFCNHKYSFTGTIPYFYYYDIARTKKCDCSVDFFECENCNKRKLVYNDKRNYKGKIWKELKMWKKHEIEINFDVSKDEAEN